MRQEAHELSEQQTADRRERKCGNAENEDLDGLHGEEVIRIRSTADRYPEKDGRDVDKLVLDRL